MLSVFFQPVGLQLPWRAGDAAAATAGAEVPAMTGDAEAATLKSSS